MAREGLVRSVQPGVREFRYDSAEAIALASGQEVSHYGDTDFTEKISE